MVEALCQFSGAVTLLGGGIATLRDVEESHVRAPNLVAADGAARFALETGFDLKAVIGDFDSIDQDTRALIPADRQHPIPEQDSTDFDKCLRSVSAPLFLCVGFTGSRLDHELAVYNVLVRRPEKRCIVIGPTDICFHLPERFEIDVPEGSRFSLFPLRAVSGESEGLRWPIGGIEFAPWSRVGTSNEAVASRVSLSLSGPGMLAILPRAQLDAVIEALRAAG
ncbi:MAG: thiamine diphosphokinase [Rhodobacteraceae bacterium]|nr:thiamine diphosphokinase [Paracoccaceae bacterium]